MLRRISLGLLFCTLSVQAQIAVTPQSILKHDDKEWLWFHPRAAAVPGMGVDDGPRMVLTLQKHLQQSDFYGGLYYMLSDDLGKTWTEPTLPPALDWIVQQDGEIVSVCDVTPQWHAASGKVIALGIKVRYRDGLQQYEKPRSHDTAYALYDPKADTWTQWQMVDTPEPEGKFYMVGPGCSQWVAEYDGSLLVPFYYRGPQESPFSVTVMRCVLEGETLRYREHGDEMHLSDERGLVEPSLIKLGDIYYLTLRNDLRGYVTRSKDGLHYEPFKPWTFDDGQELGSYNTQQHWLTHGEKLYLSYTRKGANNDHIMRNRAPLFLAEVNRDTLQVLRSTEVVLIPEAGATLGNFGATAVTPDESWVTVSEGVWDDAMRQRGADGDTWVAHICWNSATHSTEVTPGWSRAQTEGLADRILENTPENLHWAEGTKFQWVLLGNILGPDALREAVLTRLRGRYTVYLNKSDIPASMLVRQENGDVSEYVNGFSFHYSVVVESEGTVSVTYSDWEGVLAGSKHSEKYHWNEEAWSKISKSGLVVY